MACQISKWIVFPRLLLTLSAAAACGTAADSDVPDVDDDQPIVTVTVGESDETKSFAPSAAVAENAGTPTTLIFALVGPEGTRTESVAFAAHQVKLPQLRRGRWSIRGDGLNAQGNVGWSTKTVVFSVAAGKRVPVTLAFEPVE